MRWTATNPLIIGETDDTEPRHVVATGVGAGLGGFDLNEELWVQGDVADKLVLKGMFILVEDEGGFRAAAATPPVVDPVERRRQQIREQRDGLAQAVAQPPETRVRVFHTDGTVTEHEPVEEELDDDEAGEGVQVGGFNPDPRVERSGGMPPPPAARQQAKPARRRADTKGTT